MRWIEYTKLSNGQSAVICFGKNYRHEIGSGYDYAVAFAIANKKKVLRQWLNSDGYGDLDMTTTGKCGVEGLLWAFHTGEDALQKTYKQTKINVDTIIKMWYLIYKEKHN